jgi:hypothetical protein
MLLLKRLEEKYLGFNASYAQFGMMVVDGQPITTIERPWLADAIHKAGKPMISCVPPGEYKLQKEFSPKFRRNMYYLVNEDLGVFLRKDLRKEEWQRWGCMFHAANWSYQINGCIATGMNMSRMKDLYCVSRSGDAMKLLTKFLDEYERELKVVIE